MWKPKKKRESFGPIFWTNTAILWECFCLALQGISIGTNSWYIHEHDTIAFSHGGLWNECYGEIDRTFCSPLKDIPDWLIASRIFILIALCVTVIGIVYTMYAMARKNIRVIVLFAFSVLSAFLFFISLVTYMANGFPYQIKHGTSIIIAWITLITNIIGSSLTFYTFRLVKKLNKKEKFESGYAI